MRNPNLPADAPQLAHYVFRTNQLDKMVQWYCTLLRARVTFSNAGIAFITFDEEHHRLAFIAMEKYQDKQPGVSVGFYHGAFAFGTLKALLSHYERLKAQDMLPVRSINHGPTVSFYYRDPDGNDVELQVDTFPDAEQSTAWMHSEAFARNPIGVLVDPEELGRQLASGVPEAALLVRPDRVGEPS